MKIRPLFAAGTIAGFLMAGSALAQDPPSRVARLNWLIGNVSFQPSGLDTWTEATVNYPLTTGDHIFTDRGARAEMHVGSNAIRLDGESNFGFLNLDDRTVQVRFTEGSMEIRVRHLEDDDLYEIDTPQGAISLLRTGDYRIDTDPSRNATMLTVSSGEAEVTANGRSFAVHARQTAYFPDGADPDIRAANPVDDFDLFTADRNRRDDRVPPPVHVSETMAGYEDLDEYGTWSDTPDYGWAWAPRVVTGWAPYHQGRWAWVEPWGWTWVDEAPWGFAPFHYGRWASTRSGWIWVPGAVVARPVYAPALVAFVGGPRFGLSIGFGGGFGGGAAVAWFPLGPREPYYPSYHVSNNYVRQVNITHVTNINVTNINNTNVTNVRYVNQQVPGAVMAMPQQGFVTSRPVREYGQRVQQQALAQATVIGSAPQVVPRRESMLGVPTNRAVAAPSQAVMSRQVVARSAPPPPAVSFQARQQILQQNQGRPLAPDEVMQLRRQPSALVNRAPVRTMTAPPPSAAVSPRPADIARPADNPRPADIARPVDRPVDRMGTRPPNVRPVQPSPATPAPQADAPVIQTRPEFNPRPQPQQPAPPVNNAPVVQTRPEFNPRPQSPQSAPPPAVVRPMPEVRQQQPAPPPVARPVPEVRQPDVRQPEARPQPPMRQPEVRQPEVRQPEARQPEVRQPEARPQPVYREPRVEAAPPPRREAPPAPPPVREVRPEPKVEPKAEAKKDEKK